jgi:type I restriction enzyme S subunit
MKEGWVVKPLGDLYRIGSSRRVLKSQWKSEGVPFYRGREITRLSIEGFVSNELFISESHFADLIKNSGVPRSNDIMITAIGTIGNSYVVRENDRFYFKDASVLWLKQVSEVSSQYINYWIKSPLFFEQLDRGNGATVDTLTIEKLQNLKVNLPTKAEQQRIVAKLDEAFEAIASAKEKAGQNLLNARALFDSYLDDVFSHKSKDWPFSLLGDAYRIGSSKRVYERDWTSSGVPFYGGKEIVKLAKYGVTDSASFISEEKYAEYALRYEMPCTGDILMTARGTIGVGYIVRPEDRFYYKDGNVISLRAKLPSNPKFLLYAFKSHDVRDQLIQLVGATVTHLPIEKAQALKIAMPNLDTQNKAVAQLEMLEINAKELESLYQQKINALDELKQSLLHQAFSGEL